MIKISICIPAYNAEKTIEAAIASCQMQNYPEKEILVIDDGSTDNTATLAEICKGVRVIKNEKNMGIGLALERLMKEAKGKYVVYLCSDDIFTDPNVIKDIVWQFDRGDPAVGVIGRQYYEFIDGKEGAVGVFRDRMILTSSVNPSGMAFRRDPKIKGINRAFIEMPYIVKQYLRKWRWTMFEYDTVAVRIHKDNTAKKRSYYVDSAVENWDEIIGIQVKYYQQFIQLKNRSTFKMLLREINSTKRINKDAVRDPKFWFYVIIAILVPGFILRPLSYIYRDKYQRLFVKPIRRN